MSDNNNLVFKTFDEAKRYLIANPGGSIVRLDNNQGFNIKYPNKNVEAQTQPSSVQEIKARDNDDLPYTEDELKDLAKDSMLQAKRATKQKQKQKEQKQKQKEQKLRKKLFGELNAKTKKNNYNKKPQETSYPKPKPKIAEADFKRYIDEPLGTRDDFKSMRGKQGFGNKTGNH